MTQLKFEQANSEILAVWIAAGKDIPAFDSDTGRAVSIAQSIIDENHSIIEPDDFEPEDAPEKDDFTTYAEYDTACAAWAIDREQSLKEYQEEIQANYSDLFEFIETIKYKLGEDDFYIEYDGNEYRFISDGGLWGTFVEEIQNTVEDCYDLNLDKIPHFVAFEIDWEQTAKNCLVDGYAHQLSSYDGEFHVECADYNIFWTN